MLSPDPRPLVSIGLPVYNEESFLAEALDSLLAQEYPEFEIVISDNASTDRTHEICVDYAARDGRISYHPQARNAGARENFNRVFRLSRGEYFMWASGHDTRDPSMLGTLVDVLADDPELALCFSRTLCVRYGEDTLEPMDDDDLETVGLPTAERLRKTIHESGSCNAIYGLIRSSALRKTRLVRPCLGPDHVLLAELSIQGAFHRVDPALFFRRENRSAESSSVKVARTTAMLVGENARPSRHPRWMMGWEHVLGAWHASNTPPNRVRLALGAARWFWGRWHDYLLEELRAGRPVTRASPAQ